MGDGKVRSRLRVLAVLMVIMFSALTVRLWFLQVLATDFYRNEASQNSIRLVQEPAPRGEILDRDGEKVVQSRTTFEITVDRQKMAVECPENAPQLDHDPPLPCYGESRDELARLLGIDNEKMDALINDVRYYPFAPVPVAFDVSEDLISAIEEHDRLFTGVSWLKAPFREYPFIPAGPDGPIGAHLLGHIGPLSPDQIDDPAYENYDPNDIVGKDGMELVYESDLRGLKGVRQLRINAQGKVINVVAASEEPPIAGDDVVLTIDGAIQQAAEQRLADGIARVGGVAGAAVVYDVETGGIVAMASTPSFDPVIFDDGLSLREAGQLEQTGAFLPREGQGPNGTDLPPRKDCKECRALNRVTTGEYSPGSTIKPIVALAALKERIADMSTRIDCPATWSAPRDETTSFDNSDDQAHGLLSLSDALVISCDTVFYQLGYEFYRKEVSYPKDGGIEYGPSAFKRDLEDFGFGDYTGVDLPTGAAGLVPDSKWKKETWEPRVLAKAERLKSPAKQEAYVRDRFCQYEWCPGDSIQMAIGQKDLRITPLQLARAYGAIATDGKLCTPHLAAKIQAPDGSVVRDVTPECAQIEGYDQEWFKYVRGALAGVTQDNSGTADTAFAGFNFRDVSVIGKTGTAQVALQNKDNAWFAAIAEGEDADGKQQHYVVVVFIEQGGFGGDAAAPVARQIIEEAFGLKTQDAYQGEASD